MPGPDFTPNTVWSTSVPIDSTEQMILPSGQTCIAKRLGLEGIMIAGILGEADSLTAYVGKQHVRRVRGGNGPDGDEVNMASAMSDPEAMKKIVFLVDRATPLIVTDPVVHLHFTFLSVSNGDTVMIPPEKREKDWIYTDMVPLEDKMFLFNYAVGGSKDLERFRQQSANAVADIPDGATVQRPAKRYPPRRRKP